MRSCLLSNHRFVDGFLHCMDFRSNDMELILSMGVGKLKLGLDLLEFRLCFAEGLLEVLQRVLLSSNKLFQSIGSFLLSFRQFLHLNKCSRRYPFHPVNDRPPNVDKHERVACLLAKVARRGLPNGTVRWSHEHLKKEQ